MVKTDRLLSIGGWIAAAIIGMLPLASSTQFVDAASDDPPIELVNSVQGSCAHGQLSTDRGCVTPPKIKKKVQPRFPKLARRGRVPGKVVLGTIIEKDGTIGPIQVIDSSNRGHGFEEASMDAVKQWHYRPGTLANAPVRIYFIVTVDFTYR